MKRIAFLIAITSLFIINFSLAHAVDQTPKPQKPPVAIPATTPPAKPEVVLPAGTITADNCDQAGKEGIGKGVCEALKLKKAGSDESKIIGLLLMDSSYKFGYARTSMTVDQKVSLKACFSDDFIDNWIGVPQFVTLGASAIYLARDNRVVGAGLLRIFFYPRSFYAVLNTTPLSVKLTDDGAAKDFIGNFNPENHDAWIHRFALTLGLTSATGTDTSETQNFYLAGLSYEINRSALLNFGWGVSSSGNRGQIYFGITLDSNFLKVLGVMK